MLPIAVALDKVQKSSTMIATSVEIWHALANDLQSQPGSVRKQISARRDMALGPVHYLANMLDHRYLGKNLDDAQKSCAYEHFANSCHAALIPIVVAVQHGETFPQYLFKDSFKSVTPMTWWKVAAQTIPNTDTAPLRQQMIELCCQLFTAAASTAGLERIFSSFGLVHSKLRNRLGNDKAAKLTFMFRALNQEAKPSLMSKGSVEQQKCDADKAGPSTGTEPELPVLSTDVSAGDGEYSHSHVETSAVPNYTSMMTSHSTVSPASETDQSSDSDTDNDNLTVKRKRKKGKALLNKKQPVKKTARTSGYMSEEL